MHAILTTRINMEYLNLEAKCPHTLFMCLDQVCAHSLSLFNDAAGNKRRKKVQLKKIFSLATSMVFQSLIKYLPSIPDFLSLRTSAARL